MTRAIRHFLCCLMLLALAACAAPGSAPATEPTAEPNLPTPMPSSGGPTLAPSALITPLDSAACAALSAVLADAFGSEVAQSEAPFKDMITTRSGTGCQLEIRGNGVQVGTFGEATTKLHDLLKSGGWTEDMNYAADGPTASLLGFRQENRLCIAEVQWEPTADADCPADQPISACELTPEQQLFTIRLNCVQQ